MTRQPQTARKTIFVDLDGTLVRTDLFFEAVVGLLKSNPLNLFRLVVWVMRGRSYAKARVSEAVDLDIEHIPLELEFVEYLKAEKEAGNRLILATACHRHYAERVAERVGIFDGTLATEGPSNLKGAHKLAAILQEMKGEPFVYAGNGTVDRPIWAAASSGIFVNAPAKDVRAATARDVSARIFSSRPPVMRAFLREMRPHQYAKNFLVYVPLFTSHSYVDVPAFAAAVVAFICFCLCASGAYFLNDLLDLDHDRRHPSKRLRPLASGDLPIAAGVAGAALLPALAIALSLFALPIGFTIALAAYYVITNAYSFAIKRVSTADVLTLSLLYTLRVVAGAVAAAIPLSSWLMAFSVFIFVSLAYLKRYIELSALLEPERKAHGRGYTQADSESMFSLGIANMTASVVILSLYISSPEVTAIYGSPDVLWLLCLLLLYWGNRLWVGARRRKITEDPVIFAVTDRVSRMVGLCFIAVVVLAKYLEI